jgi:PAS domain S-box-containing protein
MPEETSQYRQVKRWMCGLVISCLISAFFCFYTFWVETDTGLLLALMTALLSCIIGIRLYLFDIFVLFNNMHFSRHRHADKKLSENLNQFLSASPDLFWRIRYAGREVESLNNNYADIHPGSDSFNARITTLFPARVARQYLEALIEVQSQGIMKRFEYQLPLQNNKTMTFEARIQPFSDEDCIATIRDITALKDTEETLFNQQLFVHQVMDSSPFLVFVRDRVGRFLILNQATQRTLGHDALVQSHLAIQEGNPLFSAGEQDVLEEGHSIRLIDHILLPNGEQRWFEVTKVPLIREKEVYILVTAIDITHLKLAEKSLAESEKNCSRIISQLSIPLAIIDSQTFIPVLTTKAMDNLLQSTSSPPYNAPFPFIDASLKCLLNAHEGEDSIHYTVTLPSAYGTAKQLFIFQPISYQDKRMFLALLDRSDNHYREGPDTPEQCLSTFH